MTEMDLIKAKLEYYFESGKKCHVVRKDGIYSSGKITARPRDDCYLMDEIFDGETTIFIEDVRKISDYREHR